MTDRQVNALAAFISEGREDFQAPGVVAELRRQREHYDPWQLAAAMIKRASDPANLTPRLQGFDREGFVACARHPGSTVRTDGTCGSCFADSRGVDYVPRKPRDVTADLHPLEAALSRVSRETE